MQLENDVWTVELNQGLVANLATGALGMAEGSLAYTTDEKQVYVVDASQVTTPVGGPRIALTAVVANTTATVPAGYVIDDVFMRETANHAVTGGIRIGTSAGGTQITATIAVGALSFTRTLPGTLTTSGPFSATVAQTIYIETVTAWNSASVNIIIPLKRAI